MSTGKLQAHLLDINDTANDWLDRMMPQMATAAGAIEKLKPHNQMAWVGLMNNCKARVEKLFFGFDILLIANRSDGHIPHLAYYKLSLQVHKG